MPPEEADHGWSMENAAEQAVLPWSLGFFVCLALEYFGRRLQVESDIPFLLLLPLVTTTWAAWDSTRIRIREYKSFFALPPVTLWVAIMTMWLIFFPWYLVVRSRIKAGRQARKVLIPEPVVLP